MQCCKYIKCIWVVVLFVTTTHNFYAQSYSIMPNDSITGSVPFNDLYHFIIQQNNLTSDSFILSWEKIYTEIPEGWTAYLCDLGFCYGEFPENGTMDTVPPGDYGLLSVGINPFEISGTAIVQYAVWDEALPESIDTLTWIINSDNLSAIEVDSRNDIKIFPNPANNEIHIVHESHYGNYRITTVGGSIIAFGVIHSSDFKIQLNELPEGIYFITIYDEINAFSERIIIQR